MAKRLMDEEDEAESIVSSVAPSIDTESLDAPMEDGDAPGVPNGIAHSS